MTHCSVTDRPIISSIIEGLIFLIKRREILDLAVECNNIFYLLTKINYYFGANQYT